MSILTCKSHVGITKIIGADGIVKKNMFTELGHFFYSDHFHALVVTFAGRTEKIMHAGTAVNILVNPIGIGVLSVLRW